VVTTFQSAATISRTLESVAGQTVAPHEVIVCDDGSTDATLEIVEREGVELLALPHSGIVAVSRNTGVARASGEWVAFLDGDDEWLPEHLEQFLERAASEAPRSFDLFGGNGVRVDADGEQIPFFTPRTLLAGGLVTTDELVRVRPIITSSAVARRQAVVAAGGFPEDSLVVAAEDFELWYRMSKRGGVYFDDRPHIRYHEIAQGLTKREGGWRARDAAIKVLDRLASQEERTDERHMLQEALATDRVVLAVEYLKAGHPIKAAGTMGRAAREGLRPLTTVSSKAAGRRIKQIHRTALVLTVGASITVALLGLARQKGLATILGPVGLTDLSLMLSIALPVVTLALLPMLSFAAKLNNAENEDYDGSLKLAATTCLTGFAIGALVAAVVGYQTTAIRYPLGERSGLIAALLFGLGTVGIGYASSALVFRGELRLWRRLTLAAAATQATVVIGFAIAFERQGAVWSMAITTAAIGGGLLVWPFLRARGFKVGFPERWRSVAFANGAVSITLIGVEAALRQASVDLSIATGAYFQAAISIIGAISAGAAQYTMGRLMPVATAARGTSATRRVWAEARAAFFVLGAFMALMCTGLVLLAPQVLTIAFSSEFTAASSLLRLIVVGEALVAVSTVVSTTLFGLGKTLQWAAVAITPAIARIVTYFVLAESAATTRLGWAYGVAGLVALVCAAAGYLRNARTTA
jgi:glycosyltransferase involved in cell wall biosynthesis/O-antigen/teichoic acid export membrane protein